MNYPYFNPYFNPNQNFNLGQFQNPTQPAINQTIQLGQSTNEYDAKSVNSIDEVRNTLAIKPTLFISTARDTLWFKEVNGNIKTYTLTEVVEMDAKDIKIKELQDEILKIKEMVRNEHPGSNTYENVAGTKSSESKSADANNVIGYQSATIY